MTTVLEHRVVYRSIVCLLFALLFGISTWRLSESPATWFDEGINLGIAKSLALHGVYSLPVAPGVFVEDRQFLITTNYPALLPVALSIAIGGNTLFAARFPMVVFLFLFTIIAFFLARRLYGKLPALFTLALIVSFVPFYGNGKNVLGEVPGLAIALAGMLVMLYNRHGVRGYALAGFLFGLSAATKPYYLLVLASVAVGEIFRYMRGERDWKPRAMGLGLGALGPLLAWLYTILPNPSWDGIRSMVGYYGNSYAATGFLAQMARNITRFFTESTPLHFAVLFFSSALYVADRFRKKTLAYPEVVFGFFIVATALWYLKTPGWYRYFFPAHLLLFLFFPAALLSHVRFRTAALVLLSALFVSQTVFLMTKRHDPLYYSGDAAAMASFIDASVPEHEPVLIVNAPSVAFLSSRATTRQYLEINPSLHFGEEWTTRDDTARPARVVAKGALPASVAASYREVKRFGYYALYERL